MQENLKRLTKLFIFCLFCCLSFPLFQFPEHNFNISKVGEWGGFNSLYYDVAITGKYAYCVGYYGLDIVDISSPSSPQLVASYPDSSTGYEYYVRVVGVNNRAYILVNQYPFGRLYIMDISNPTTPSLWGSIPLSGYGKSLCIKGQYAYVGTGDKGTIDIIDISGSTPPTTIITYTAGWPVWNIHVSGDYLYATASSLDSGVKILDISEPTSPSFVSEIKSQDGYYYVSDIFTAGNYAYFFAYNKGLIIYDISIPQSPKKVGEYLDYETYYRLQVEDSLAFALDYDKLTIFDVSNPSNPVLKIEYKYPGCELRGVHCEGNLAYIADYGRGLRIVDTSDPANPLYLGSLEYYGTANAITGKGKYLYSGKSYGLHIMDISDPTSPTHQSFVETENSIASLAIKDSYVFVLMGDYRAWSPCYLQVYNVFNPLSPTLVAEVSLGEYTYYDLISIHGNYAYASGEINGERSFKIFDISDPTSPKQTSELSVSGQSLCFKGKYAYLLSLSSLTVLDISSPSSPRVTNTISLDNDVSVYAEDMAIKGNYAYIVADNTGILLYDLSNPVSPSLVKHYKGNLHFIHIKSEGNYAYLADENNGLLNVIDISNPLLPTLMGYQKHKYEWVIRALMVQSGIIYCQYSGYLMIFRFQPDESPPQITLDRDALYFSAVTGGAGSPSQSVWVEVQGAGSLYWWTSTDEYWLDYSTSSLYDNTGSDEIKVSVDADYLVPGSYTGTLSVDSNVSFFDPNAAIVVPVYLQIYDPTETNVPFGEMATPLNNSVVSGSVPFTGWALDDIGVQAVKLYLVTGKTLNLVGDAVFVAGARPDVESAYHDYPMAYKAGWGYMMLTNFLPNGGNGTYIIRAVATDMEGNSVTLGNKTIHVDNANAVKPFGAIDTPEQGGLASGNNYINFGWVLTPQPNFIPKDGSTIRVWVDGKSLGNPVYNRYRSDIHTLFPGYNNSSGAGGNFSLDTTKYSNGVHTIQWTASDNAGNTDGIGSRYFTIQNSQTWNAAGTKDSSGRRRHCLVEADTVTPVWIKKGFAVD
jgi:hypothetical protein